MRVTRAADGTFIVQDAPMELTGRAAKQFRADLERPETPEQKAKREAFLAECVRIHSSK